MRFNVRTEKLKTTGHAQPRLSRPRPEPTPRETETEKLLADLIPEPEKDPLRHRLLLNPSALKKAAAEWEKKFQDKTAKQESARHWMDLAKKLLKNEYVRLAPPPHPEGIEGLNRKYPHLSAALETIRDYLDISRLSQGPAHLPPILLVGPPGAGKTAFAIDFAKVLDVPSRTLNSVSLTHSFILAGLDMGWASGREGMILSLLLEGIGNPILILDEIDKAGKSLSGSSSSPSLEDFLLGVLEPITAKTYVDEFLSSDYPVDASHIQWIFTANDLKELSGPLLSRLTVIPVRSPTVEELREAIIPHLYRDILEENRLVGKVPESLPEEALQRLSGSPREARKRILQLLAAYARSGMFEAPERESLVRDRRPIGFNL